MFPCATFKNNKINTDYYSCLLEKMVKEELPNSYLVIERNSYGKAIIDRLVRRIPDKLFYDYAVKEKDKDKIYNTKKDNIKYGVDTTTQSRDAMIDLLFQIVDEDPQLLAIKDLYDEVRTLVYNSKGKVEHEKGCHDDVVFAYLFVRYIVTYSNSIATFLRRTTSISENASQVIGSSWGKPKTIQELNRVQKPDEAVSGLTLMEIIELREKGIDVAKYAKEKFSPKSNGRELQVNNSTLTLIRR
jgi:hypothetical protein